MFVVPRASCRASDDIMLVPAKAYGTDGKNEGNKVVELLLLLRVLGSKGPHLFRGIRRGVTQGGIGALLGTGGASVRRSQRHVTHPGQSLHG